MKKIVAICALLGILLQTFSQVVIVADFYVHKDYIAKNLCENRNKPQMHCNGACCLKKKLAKQDKDQAPTGSQKEPVVTLFFSDARINIPHPLAEVEKSTFTTSNDLRTFSYHSPIFHPPGA